MAVAFIVPGERAAQHRYRAIEAALAAIDNGDADALRDAARIEADAEDPTTPALSRAIAAMDVLLTSHQRLVRACLAQLMRNGEGRVINIASTEGLGATRHA